MLPVINYSARHYLDSGHVTWPAGLVNQYRHVRLATRTSRASMKYNNVIAHRIVSLHNTEFGPNAKLPFIRFPNAARTAVVHKYLISGGIIRGIVIFNFVDNDVSKKYRRYGTGRVYRNEIIRRILRLLRLRRELNHILRNPCGVYWTHVVVQRCTNPDIKFWVYLFVFYSLYCYIEDKVSNVMFCKSQAFASVICSSKKILSTLIRRNNNYQPDIEVYFSRKCLAKISFVF